MLNTLNLLKTHEGYLAVTDKTSGDPDYVWTGNRNVYILQGVCVRLCINTVASKVHFARFDPSASLYC